MSAAAPTPVSPKRVLLVEINHDGTVGGSHQALFDLVRSLDRERYTPVVLFYQDNAYVERLRALGVRVLLWDRVWAREHGVRRRWWHPVQLERMVEAVVRRARLLRRERIDLLHVNNSPAYAYADWFPAARLTGVPCISHCRGAPYPVENAVIRAASRRFDRLITISAYVTDVLTTAGIPRAVIAQIEDGIDIEALRARVSRPARDVRAALGVPDDARLAVMVGHFRRWKGQDVVVDAVARLEPAQRARLRVVFAGGEDPRDPEFLAELRQRVRDEGLAESIAFLGARADAPDLMNASDVVLHASTTAEPFGLVVVEAMALGRLIIASALGGPAQVVTEGSGWTFSPVDPSQLAALLARVVDDPAAAGAASTNARARAEEFTIERTVSAVQSVYAEVLGERGSALVGAPAAAPGGERLPAATLAL